MLIEKRIAAQSRNLLHSLTLKGKDAITFIIQVVRVTITGSWPHCGCCSAVPLLTCVNIHPEACTGQFL